MIRMTMLLRIQTLLVDVLSEKRLGQPFGGSRRKGISGHANINQLNLSATEWPYKLPSCTGSHDGHSIGRILFCLMLSCPKIPIAPLPENRLIWISSWEYNFKQYMNSIDRHTHSYL